MSTTTRSSPAQDGLATAAADVLLGEWELGLDEQTVSASVDEAGAVALELESGCGESVVEARLELEVDGDFAAFTAEMTDELAIGVDGFGTGRVRGLRDGEAVGEHDRAGRGDEAGLEDVGRGR